MTRRVFTITACDVKAEKASYSGPERVFADQYVQLRLVCSVGDSPTGVKVRRPVAWIALVEETKLMKSIDKAIFRMVSESPGRNASELTGGLEKNVNRKAEPSCPG
jgi:hypothetical protein